MNLKFAVAMISYMQLKYLWLLARQQGLPHAHLVELQDLRKIKKGQDCDPAPFFQMSFSK